MHTHPLAPYACQVHLEAQASRTSLGTVTAKHNERSKIVPGIQSGYYNTLGWCFKMLSLSLVRNKQTESSEAGMKAQKKLNFSFYKH